MDVLVAYESQRGRARRAAQAVAEAAAGHGVATLVRPIDDVEASDIAGADALIAGCWVRGDVPFGGEPARRMAAWVRGLPDLGGKPAGVYCTYRFFPHTFADTAARTAETLHKIGTGLELRGAAVTVTQSIHFGAMSDGAAKLIHRLLKQVPTA